MSFSKVYVLGDSLSDTGTFTLTTFGLSLDPALAIPSPLLGYDGRFSNGPVAVEVAASLFDAPIAEDRVGLAAEARDGVQIADLAATELDITRPESSFAYGSARSTGSRTLGEIAIEAGLDDALADALGDDPELLAQVQGFDINLGAQVQRLTATLALEAPPEDALATIFIGLNDFEDFAPSSEAAAPAEAYAMVLDILNATDAAARAAADGGIDTVALFTLPSASAFPPGPGDPPDPDDLALADLAIDVHALGLRFVQLGLLLDGIDARVVDLGAMVDLVDADPGAFGFETLDVVTVEGTGSDGAFNPAAAAFEPDELGFYDFIHFSGALHGVLGAFTARTLTSRTAFGSEAGDTAGFGDGGALAFGAAGADLLFGGSGEDAFFGGADRDFLFGSGGDDLLAGQGDADALYGGSGDDALIGGEGEDLLRGGDGDDLLLVIAGREIAEAGDGDDVMAIDLAGSVAEARLFGALGEDVLVVLNADAAFGGDLEAALAAQNIEHSGFESVVGGFDAALDAEDARWGRLEEIELWGLYDLPPEAEPPLLG